MLTDRHMEIDLRRRDILVPEQILNPSQVRPVFQQMSRKTMTERMARDLFM